MDLGFAWCSIRQFEQQLQWLAGHGYETITLRDYARSLGSDEANDRLAKKAVLTFDDAYACLGVAAECMAKHNYIGTCFAISRFVGRYNKWDYQFFARRHRHADRALLQDLHAAGWEIGSHTRTHPYLKPLPQHMVLDELQGSREELAALVGEEVCSISYPFGRTDARICSLAEAAGYRCGVGLGLPGSAGNGVNRMWLPRLGIYVFDTLSSFSWKINAFEKNSTACFLLQRAISAFAAGTIALKHAKRILLRRNPG